MVGWSTISSKTPIVLPKHDMFHLYMWNIGNSIVVHPELIHNGWCIGGCCVTWSNCILWCTDVSVRSHDLRPLLHVWEANISHKDTLSHWQSHKELFQKFPFVISIQSLFRFMMMTFTSCFVMGKAEGWGTFPNYLVRLNYQLVLGPLFGEWHHAWALPTQKDIA